MRFDDGEEINDLRLGELCHPADATAAPPAPAAAAVPAAAAPAAAAPRIELGASVTARWNKWDLK